MEVNTYYQTHWALEQWARWAKTNNGSTLGYPKTFIAKAKGGSVPLPIVQDDEAMLIDSIVAGLALRHKEIGDALAIYYLGGCNLSRAARALKINRKRADVLVQSGIAWIDARLSLP